MDIKKFLMFLAFKGYKKYFVERCSIRNIVVVDHPDNSEEDAGNDKAIISFILDFNFRYYKTFKFEGIVYAGTSFYNNIAKIMSLQIENETISVSEKTILLLDVSNTLVNPSRIRRIRSRRNNHMKPDDNLLLYLDNIITIKINKLCDRGYI